MSQAILIYVALACNVFVICWFGTQLTQDVRGNGFIIIIIVIISFMQCIHTYIPEKNDVPREYSVAAILLLLFMVLISLVSVWIYCIFTLVLSEVRVQCPIWLFSVLP